MKKLMITIVVLTLTISMAIGFASPVGANGPIYLEYYDDSGGGAGDVEAAVASADGYYWDLASWEYVIFRVPDPYIGFHDNTSNPEIRIDTPGNGVLVHDAEVYVTDGINDWTYVGTYSDNIDADIDLDSIPYDGIVRYVGVVGVYTTDPQLMYDLDAAEILVFGFTVEIDIKPMFYPNPLNVNSKGLLPVAILGTDIFDVSMVDPASVELMGVSPVSWALKDVATPGQEEAGPDGYMDLVLHFDTQELSAALGEVLDAQVLTLELTGNLQAGYGGGPIIGEGDVTIINKAAEPPAEHQDLYLGDDDYEEVALGFTFKYQGQKWATVFVNSNGHLTFGSGDNSWNESVSEFLNDQPRIAALWDDLNPTAGGQICVDREIKKGMVRSLTVSFIDVPEYDDTGANTFSITLRQNNQIEITYGDVSATDGIVGVTEGGGAANPGETDLSEAGILSSLGTTYEQFIGGGDNFDLQDMTLKFRPL